MHEDTHRAMPGAIGPKSSADEQRTLLYWLANEDLYTSTYVRNWLQRTPPEEAGDILARIARNAQPEPHSLWYTLSRGFIVMFTTSEAISDNNPAGRKAGTRAALLLANGEDVRGLAPLVRVFETSMFWEGKYQEDIETALLRFLSGTEHPNLSENAEDLRNLAERIWRSGSGRKELSRRRTDLLLAALRCLKDLGGEPEIALLKSIAAAKATAPNRAKIRETAIALLSDSR